jgi:4-amino-4-deoxy-L-arabinose transferase-like glycosyltransferase
MNVTKTFLVVIIISTFMSFFRIGSVKLFDVDEAVFAQATKEMLESNDWLTPTYNGENRYDKPVLFYWLMTTSYKLFGINEFGARFPSAMAACMLAFSLFFFAKNHRSEKFALYTVLTFVLSLYFFVYSHSSVTDMSLSLFISLSLFSFYLYQEGSGKPLALYGFYIFSALAFLTKGLIGIAFPFGVAITYMFSIERGQGVKKVFNLKAMSLFLAVAAPWYGAQLIVNGHEFFDQFIMKHHFKRYLGVISGHRGPVYYYIPAFIMGLFPWSIFFPAGARNAIKAKDRLGLFALVWFTFIFVFFTFSTTKLPNYILPAIPAASILIASGMTEHTRRWARYSHLFLAVISLMIASALLIARIYLLKYGIFDVNWIFVAASTMVVMAIFSFYRAYFVQKPSFGALSVLMTIFLLTLSMKAMPIASDYLQGTLHRYSLYAKAHLHGEQRILAYDMNNPSIVFYSDHKIISAGSKKGVQAALDSNREISLAITKIKKIDALEAMGFHVIESDGKYALLVKKGSQPENNEKSLLQ